MEMRGNGPRPLGVTIIGLLYGLGALSMFFMAAFLIVGLGSEDSIILQYIPILAELDPYLTLIAGAIIIGGALLLIIGLLFLNGWTPAWYIVLILQVLSLLSDLISLAETGAFGSLVITAVIIYYLFRPHVKEFFWIDLKITG